MASEPGAPDREAGRASAKRAGIALVVVGSLGLLASLASLLMSQMVIEATRAGHADPEAQQFIDVMFGTGALLIYGPAIVLALLTLAGGVATMRASMRGLAYVGAICAMLVPSACCCVVGVPVGIWALVVLGKPHVKAAFE